MNKVIVIIGPTAVGKTKLSIDLAKKLQTDIISGDSMLIYKHMNIGTAKPTIEEQQGIYHHMVDILEPNQEFSVVEFKNHVQKLIEELNQKAKIPIIAGGTGLYVKSILENYQFNAVDENKELRQKLTKLARIKGNYHLHGILRKLAPTAAERLHQNDTKRVIRAIESHLSGEDVSQQKENFTNSNNNLAYDTFVLGLIMERKKLYERINLRVDMMIEDGLVSEVKTLLDQGISPNCQAMQGIGYKEIVAYLNEEYSLDEAIHIIKQSTRRFAKRQLTWFRSMPYINWINVDEYEDSSAMLELIYNQLEGKFLEK